MEGKKLDLELGNNFILHRIGLGIDFEIVMTNRTLNKSFGVFVKGTVWKDILSRRTHKESER